MNISLENKNAVICGSTQGIGLAAAQELALLGATCTLIARNEVALQAAVKSLSTSFHQQHNYLVADFSQPETVRAAITKHTADHKVHVLVNNTGGPAAGPVTEASEEAFVNAFNQHIVCNQILVKACIPSMKKEAYGRIINVISTSVKIPLNNLGVSNTIRGAVASWAKTMANELGEFHITVNNVLPGFTATKRLKSLAKHIADSSGKTIAAVEEEMKKDVPAKRFGTAAEIAALIAFLASPAASYINGTSIPADGGRTGSI